MKKRKLKTLLTLLFVVLTLTMMTAPVQAAQKKAVKITTDKKRTTGNKKEYWIIKGLDSKNKVVWRYKTKKFGLMQCTFLGCTRNKDKVYILENHKLTVRRLKDGKILWSLSNLIPYGHVFSFDKSGNFYLTGAMEDDVYKISPKGKILWKSNVAKTRNYWPCKFSFSQNKVTVFYSGDMDANYHFHHVIFSIKTGRILKYD